MNLGQLRTKILGFLGESQERFFVEIDDWINDNSFEITKELNYPWKKQEETAVADQADYAVPSGFIKIFPLLPAYYDGNKIDLVSVGMLDRDYSGWRNFTATTNGTTRTGTTGATLIDTTNANFKAIMETRVITRLSDSATGLVDSVDSTTQITTTGITDWSVGESYSITYPASGTPDKYYSDLPSYISLYVPPDDTLTFLYYYVYKETAMSADASTNLVATNYPLTIVYKTVWDCEMKRGATDVTMARWENAYVGELLKSKGLVNRQLRGLGEMTRRD